MRLWSAQLWLASVAAVFAPLFFGSVDLFWVVGLTLVLSLGGLCCLVVPLNLQQTRFLAAFLGVCLAYALIALIQIIPNSLPSFNDPIWSKVGGILQIDSQRMSSRSEIPPIAVGHFLLFATAFLNGFCVGTSHRHSTTLVRVVSVSILVYALYGIAALILTPNSLLWIDKTFYTENLTATFVNRNTAASLIGTGAILWLCKGLAHAETLRISSIKMMLMEPANETWLLGTILRLIGLLVCFVALLETGSRGGLLFATAGMLTAAAVVFAVRAQLNRWLVVGCILAIGVAGVSIVLNLGRVGTQGLFDDNRWSVYQSLFPSLAQRPWLGSGAGTFQDIFPVLRSPHMNSGGIWEMAHSTILEIAVEMGLPMAFLVIASALACVILLVRGASKAKGSDLYLLAAIAGIAVFSFLHSLVDFSLQIPGYSTVFAILLGCGLARALAVRRATPNDTAHSEAQAES